GKARRQAAEDGRQRPDRAEYGQSKPASPFVAQPADRRLQEIGKAEDRERQTELGVGEAEFPLDLRRRDRDDVAVDHVQEVAKRYQDDDPTGNCARDRADFPKKRPNGKGTIHRCHHNPRALQPWWSAVSRLCDPGYPGLPRAKPARPSARKHQITRHPWRTSPPLRPSLSFRYTHRPSRDLFFDLRCGLRSVARTGLRVSDGLGQNQAKLNLCLRRLPREVRFLKL